MEKVKMVFLTILAILLFVILALGTWRTILTQTASSQKVFISGKVPTPAPDGFYKGSVGNLKTTWKGKTFRAQDSSGINNFEENGRKMRNYAFRTYVGKGIQDRDKDVLKIDYNISGNPLWLRFILDEVVETQPDTLLGKLHIRILPEVAFTLGYFSLKQE